LLQGVKIRYNRRTGEAITDDVNHIQGKLKMPEMPRQRPGLSPPGYENHGIEQLGIISSHTT
jgi:hypothetical protein